MIGEIRERVLSLRICSQMIFSVREKFFIQGEEKLKEIFDVQLFKNRATKKNIKKGT